MASFTPLLRYPRLGDWVDLRAGLNAVEKETICFPCQESTHNPSVAQFVAYSLLLHYRRVTVVCFHYMILFVE
jgi:hypothetical protein